MAHVEGGAAALRRADRQKGPEKLRNYGRRLAHDEDDNDDDEHKRNVIVMPLLLVLVALS